MDAGDWVSPAAMDATPMPMKNRTIMRVAPIRSLSMPAGSAAAPTRIEPSVHSEISSWYGSRQSSSSASTMTK